MDELLETKVVTTVVDDEEVASASVP